MGLKHVLIVKLAHRSGDLSRFKTGGGGAAVQIVLVSLQDADGVVGIGGKATILALRRCQVRLAFLKRVDPRRLSFADLPGSMAYLTPWLRRSSLLKGALNVALMDGAAQKAGKPIVLNLELAKKNARTSSAFGIDKPEIIRQKVAEAARCSI